MFKETTLTLSAITCKNSLSLYNTSGSKFALQRFQEVADAAVKIFNLSLLLMFHHKNLTCMYRYCKQINAGFWEWSGGICSFLIDPEIFWLFPRTSSGSDPGIQTEIFWSLNKKNLGLFQLRKKSEWKFHAVPTCPLICMYNFLLSLKVYSNVKCPEINQLRSSVLVLYNVL